MLFYLHLTVTILPLARKCFVEIKRKSSPTSPPPPLKGRNQFASVLYFCIIITLGFLIIKTDRFSPLGETGERSKSQRCKVEILYF